MTPEVKNIINLLDIIEEENKKNLEDTIINDYYVGIVKGQLILIKVIKNYIDNMNKKKKLL